MMVNDAEECLLGCILMDGDLINDATVEEEHFTKEMNRAVFRAMRNMQKRSETIDSISMMSYFISQPGIAEHVADISIIVPSANEFYRYQRTVMHAWRLRRAREIALGLNEQVGADGDAVRKTIEELSKLEDGLDDDEDGDDLSDTLIEMQAEFDTDLGALTGINTGYSDLNAYTGGWNDEDLIIIGARPSVGKTAFVLNTLRYAAENGAVASIFSLETRKKKLLKRIIAAVGYIDATKLRNPYRFFEPDDWPKLTLAMSTIANMRLVIHDNPNVTVSTIRSKLKRTIKKYPEKKHLVAIDYLQLISAGNQKENRAQELGAISRSLKLLAREFHVPIIALAQLTRSVEQRQDKRPMLSDLRESGSIEQDADIICFLYRDDYYNPESERQNIVELIIGKNRDGDIGKVELVFLKQFNKFVDLARG